MIYSRIFENIVVFGHHYFWVLGFISFRFSPRNVSVQFSRQHFIYSLILQTIFVAFFPYFALETIKNVGFFTEPVVIYITVISFIFRTSAIIIIVTINFYSQPTLCNTIESIYQMASEFPKFDIDLNLLLILSAKTLNYVAKLFLHFYMNVKTTDEGKNLLLILRCFERFIECTVLDVSPIGYILGLLLIGRLTQLANEYLLSFIADFQKITLKSEMRKIFLIQIRLVLVQNIKIQKDVFKVTSRFHEILQVQVLLSTAFSFFNNFSFCYFFYYATAAVHRSFYEQNLDPSIRVLLSISCQFVDLLILTKVADDTMLLNKKTKDVLFQVFPMIGYDAKLDEIVSSIA